MKQRILFAFALIVGMGVFFLFPRPHDPGVPPGNDLKESIARVSADETIQVNVWMKDQLDLREIKPEVAHLSWPEQRVLMINLLKQHARRSQEDLLKYLAHKKGEVEVVKTFWIANLLTVRARPALIEEISNRADVALVEADMVKITPAGAKSAWSESMSNNAESNLKVINAHKLWSLGYTGEGVIVMNIDTGVMGDHPALQASWRGNVAPASESWHDAVFGTTTPAIACSDPHGTGTMSVMVGLDPTTEDTVGIAFGARWIASTFDCSTFEIRSSVFDALQWGVDPDGDPNTTDDVPVVINCSLRSDADALSKPCGNNYASLINTNIETMGIAVVYAAGNQTSPQEDDSMAIPARHPDVWAVGLVDATDPNHIILRPDLEKVLGCYESTLDLRAPGVNIRVASNDPTNYRIVSGTSESTPHVAGAIALLKQAFPNKTGPELRDALFATRDPQLKLIDVEAALHHLGNVVVSQYR